MLGLAMITAVFLPSYVPLSIRPFSSQGLTSHLVKELPLGFLVQKLQTLTRKVGTYIYTNKCLLKITSHYCHYCLLLFYCCCGGLPHCHLSNNPYSLSTSLFPSPLLFPLLLFLFSLSPPSSPFFLFLLHKPITYLPPFSPLPPPLPHLHFVYFLFLRFHSWQAHPSPRETHRHQTASNSQTLQVPT